MLLLLTCTLFQGTHPLQRTGRCVVLSPQNACTSALLGGGAPGGPGRCVGASPSPAARRALGNGGDAIPVRRVIAGMQIVLARRCDVGESHGDASPCIAPAVWTAPRGGLRAATSVTVSPNPLIPASLDARATTHTAAPPRGRSSTPGARVSASAAARSRRPAAGSRPAGPTAPSRPSAA
jgi:hypothetical protein